MQTCPILFHKAYEIMTLRLSLAEIALLVLKLLWFTDNEIVFSFTCFVYLFIGNVLL